MATAWWRTACGLLIVCLPLLAACATLSAAVYAIVQPVALDYGEPVVYGIALRVVTGQPLYQSLDTFPFTVAAYTPLYYWVGGGLQAMFGPGFGPGRALSLGAGVTTALLIAVIAGRQQWGVWVGTFAGVLFLAFGFPGPDTPWLGLYRVDVLGVALSVAAIAVLGRDARTSTIVVAGVLAGLAVLCKQTFVAALIAGAVFQWRKSGLLFATSALATFGIPCAVLQLTTGGAFLQNTVGANANPFYLSESTRLLTEFGHAQWLPLLLAGVYLWLARPWQAPESRLVVVYWAVAGVSLAQLGKIGANHNYWIEFAAATAILAARGAACLVRRPVFAAALVVALVVQLGGPVGAVVSARALRSDIRSAFTAPRDIEFEALVDRVRHAPGSVIAEPMDVVVLAGRQVLLEPFIFNILLDTGHWRADPVVDRICAGDVGLLVLAYPMDVGAGMTDGLHALWTPAVMAALADTMELEGVQGQRYVYSRSASARCRTYSALSTQHSVL
jgi:hypothetical protein